MPTWSDGEAAAAEAGAGEAAAGGAPGAEGAAGIGAGPTPDAWFARAGLAAEDTGQDVAAAHAPDACPWCATPAAAGATRCATCGAALAQRESIGDLVIPGLTAVDPALKDLDGRPIHLRGPSASQGVASGIIVAAAAGGPMGLAILGGVGAIAATEFLGAGGDKGKGHEHVGETSEAVLQAVERLDRGETLPTAKDSTPRPDLDLAGALDQDGNQEDAIDGQA
jgi:hypothetical protein